MLAEHYPQLHIGLASPDRIRQAAERRLPSGEIVGLVTEPYTIHYQTFQPERHGLFCEKIFGPTRTGYCSCGQYQGVTNLPYAQCCEHCGVELTDARVRRYNMGYIHLFCPVVHAWYLKSAPSLLARLLDQPLKTLIQLVYCDV